VDVATSFYQNVRFEAYLAGTRTEGREGDNLSYRGFFDYNADRFGAQVERLVVEPNFLPDEYDSDPRADVVALRNRAIVVKFNRLFRL